MGWDAIAVATDGTELERSVGDNYYQLADRYLHVYFTRLAKQVAQEVGSVDGDLCTAGLDCSNSGRALEKATGENVWSGSWSAAEVKQFAAQAQWPKKPDGLEASAKAFLEACAKLNLGIRFSY